MEKINANDPRFTAKALNEESDELDDVEIENADVQEFEDLQNFAATLKSELHNSKESDKLNPDRLAVIKREAAAPKKRIIAFPVWAGSLAACVAVGFVSYLVIRDNMPSGEIFLSSPEPSLIRVDTTEASKEEERHLAEGESVEAVASGDGAVMQPFREATEEFDQATLLENGPLNLKDELTFRAEPSDDLGYRSTNSTSGTTLSTEVKNVPLSIEAIASEYVADFDASEPGRVLSASESRQKKDVQVAANGSENYSVASKAVADRSHIGRLSQQQMFVPRPAPILEESFNREGYDFIEENEFISPLNQQLSTFSIDVDTASYSNTRRFINQGQLPPADAVRIEELINYFRYQYQEPEGDAPFSVKVDAANAPWKPEHRLVRIALKGKDVPVADRLDANLVFLIDVSGSMVNSNKLPLVQQSLKMLVDQMEARDRIALVVYAGASGLALPSTTANNKETIKHAIDQLRSGGSTNGGAGIELAYKVAQEQFVEGGINRVILCTDGDFNVGNSDQGSLVRLIEEKRQSKVFFSAMGFGMGNYRDDMMETLSNKGNGNYAYIDSEKEARKVFVDEMMGSLQTIAKDVKIQVEFNPSQVSAYRLIGYENRKLAKEDFNDDTKDAGEIGAGHRVTALYEVVPVGVTVKTGSVDPLKYQRPQESLDDGESSQEMLTVKLRYKQPEEEVSQLMEQPFMDGGASIDSADTDLRFTAAVAAWGMLLRDSQYKGDFAIEGIIDLATSSKGVDSGGLRSEFVELVRKSGDLLEASAENNESLLGVEE